MPRISSSAHKHNFTASYLRPLPRPPLCGRFCKAFVGLRLHYKLGLYRGPGLVRARGEKEPILPSMKNALFSERVRLAGRLILSRLDKNGCDRHLKTLYVEKMHVTPNTEDLKADNDSSLR